VHLTSIDRAIMLVHFVFVLGIGFLLRRRVKTSTDFFLAGRAIPAWVCGLAFISANLGAQEVIGMAASGAKYGIAASHFYWVGAIRAMVFVGIFMMPFYYGSRARPVPEYLRLRFDEKTRGLNAISFAIMTVFSSGISMYAMARLIQILHVLDPYQKPHSCVFCSRRSFYDCPSSSDSARTRLAIAFNDTNRASARHVPVESVRRVVVPTKNSILIDPVEFERPPR
jgi:uncharacterized sodium:solute symporter family permease YidK